MKIKNVRDHKVITWTTKNHWASAPYKESSEEDLQRICQRLKETITDVYYSKGKDESKKQIEGCSYCGKSSCNGSCY